MSILPSVLLLNCSIGGSFCDVLIFAISVLPYNQSSSRFSLLYNIKVFFTNKLRIRHLVIRTNPPYALTIQFCYVNCIFCPESVNILLFTSDFLNCTPLRNHNVELVVLKSRYKKNTSQVCFSGWYSAKSGL